MLGSNLDLSDLVLDILHMTVPLCIRQGSKRNYDSVSEEELDWSAKKPSLNPS